MSEAETLRRNVHLTAAVDGGISFDNLSEAFTKACNLAGQLEAENKRLREEIIAAIEQQPEAGEFTKRLRSIIADSKSRPVAPVEQSLQKIAEQACDLLDRQVGILRKALSGQTVNQVLNAKDCDAS